MFMNDNVAFEVSFGYQSISQKDKENNEDNVRRINGGIVFGFGVSVVL
jgi:hypothetical protein